MPPKLIKILALLLCFLLIFEQSGFAQVAGQLDISGYLTGLRNSFIQEKFRPLHLRYLSYDNLNNTFKLLLDKGDTIKGLSPKGTDPKDISKGTVPDLESATKELLKYFFIGITLPNSSFWVNLRPDSPDNIIDDFLAQTDIGNILLEADLQLKKDTASFTSPQTPEGKKYWDKLYQKAEELLGPENLSIPTLVRPWILPAEIIIRETKDNAYIYKATLKVMLEQDYLKDSATYNFSDPRLKALNEYSSTLLKELIIPKLTKEINNAKRYAPLRQVYYSLILAQWFKSRFYAKGGLYSWLIDKKNLSGLISEGNWSQASYFKEYQKSFKDGEYNLKEPIQTPYGQSIRSYFSGGMNLAIEMPAAPTAGSPVSANGPTTALLSQRASAPNTSSVVGINVENPTHNLNEPYAVKITRTQPAEEKMASAPASSPVVAKKNASVYQTSSSVGARLAEETYAKERDRITKAAEQAREQLIPEAYRGKALEQESFEALRDKLMQTVPSSPNESLPVALSFPEEVKILGAQVELLVGLNAALVVLEREAAQAPQDERQRMVSFARSDLRTLWQKAQDKWPNGIFGQALSQKDIRLVIRETFKQWRSEAERVIDLAEAQALEDLKARTRLEGKHRELSDTVGKEREEVITQAENRLESDIRLFSDDQLPSEIASEMVASDPRLQQAHTLLENYNEAKPDFIEALRAGDSGLAKERAKGLLAALERIDEIMRGALVSLEVRLPWHEERVRISGAVDILTGRPYLPGLSEGINSLALNELINLLINSPLHDIDIAIVSRAGITVDRLADAWWPETREWLRALYVQQRIKTIKGLTADEEQLLFMNELLERAKRGLISPHTVEQWLEEPLVLTPEDAREMVETLWPKASTAEQPASTEIAASRKEKAVIQWLAQHWKTASAVILVATIGALGLWALLSDHSNSGADVANIRPSSAGSLDIPQGNLFDQGIFLTQLRQTMGLDIPADVRREELAVIAQELGRMDQNIQEILSHRDKVGRELVSIRTKEEAEFEARFKNVTETLEEINKRIRQGKEAAERAARTPMKSGDDEDAFERMEKEFEQAQQQMNSLKEELQQTSKLTERNAQVENEIQKMARQLEEMRERMKYAQEATEQVQKEKAVEEQLEHINKELEQTQQRLKEAGVEPPITPSAQEVEENQRRFEQAAENMQPGRHNQTAPAPSESSSGSLRTSPASLRNSAKRENPSGLIGAQTALRPDMTPADKDEPIVILFKKPMPGGLLRDAVFEKFDPVQGIWTQTPPGPATTVSIANVPNAVAVNTALATVHQAFTPLPMHSGYAPIPGSVRFSTSTPPDYDIRQDNAGVYYLWVRGDASFPLQVMFDIREAKEEEVWRHRQPTQEESTRMQTLPWEKDTQAVVESAQNRRYTALQISTLLAHVHLTGEYMLTNSLDHHTSYPSDYVAGLDRVKVTFNDGMAYRVFDCDGANTYLAALVRAIGLPARLVTGYASRNFSHQVTSGQRHALLEVFDAATNTWLAFDSTPPDRFPEDDPRVGPNKTAERRLLALFNALYTLDQQRSAMEATQRKLQEIRPDVPITPERQIILIEKLSDQLKQLENRLLEQAKKNPGALVNELLSEDKGLAEIRRILTEAQVPSYIQARYLAATLELAMQKLPPAQARQLQPAYLQTLQQWLNNKQTSRPVVFDQTGIGLPSNSTQVKNWDVSTSFPRLVVPSQTAVTPNPSHVPLLISETYDYSLGNPQGEWVQGADGVILGFVTPLTGGKDTIRFYDLTGRPVFQEPPDSIDVVQVEPDGAVIMQGRYVKEDRVTSASLYRWDGNTLKQVTSQHVSVEKAFASSTGKIFYLAGPAETANYTYAKLQLWQLGQEKPLSPAKVAVGLTTDGYSVQGIYEDAKGRIYYTGTIDDQKGKQIRAIWQVGKNEPVYVFSFDENLDHLRFGFFSAPDGTVYVALHEQYRNFDNAAGKSRYYSNDRIIRLQDGYVIAASRDMKYYGLLAGEYTLSFSPDSTLYYNSFYRGLGGVKQVGKEMLLAGFPQGFSTQTGRRWYARDLKFDSDGVGYYIADSRDPKFLVLPDGGVKRIHDGKVFKASEIDGVVYYGGNPDEEGNIYGEGIVRDHPDEPENETNARLVRLSDGKILTPPQENVRVFTIAPDGKVYYTAGKDVLLEPGMRAYGSPEMETRNAKVGLLPSGDKTTMRDNYMTIPDRYAGQSPTALYWEDSAAGGLRLFPRQGQETSAALAYQPARELIDGPRGTAVLLGESYGATRALMLDPYKELDRMMQLAVAMQVSNLPAEGAPEWEQWQQWRDQLVARAEAEQSPFMLPQRRMLLYFLTQGTPAHERYATALDQISHMPKDRQAQARQALAGIISGIVKTYRQQVADIPFNLDGALKDEDPFTRLINHDLQTFISRQPPFRVAQSPAAQLAVLNAQLAELTQKHPWLALTSDDLKDLWLTPGQLLANDLTEMLKQPTMWVLTLELLAALASVYVEFKKQATREQFMTLLNHWVREMDSRVFPKLKEFGSFSLEEEVSKLSEQQQRQLAPYVKQFRAAPVDAQAAAWLILSSNNILPSERILKEQIVEPLTILPVLKRALEERKIEKRWRELARQAGHEPVVNDQVSLAHFLQSLDFLKQQFVDELAKPEPVTQKPESASSPINDIDIILKRHIDKIIPLDTLVKETGLSKKDVVARINQINQDKNHRLLIKPASGGNMYITTKETPSSQSSSPISEPISRRQLLKWGVLAGAGVATAGLGYLAWRLWPSEVEVVPQVEQAVEIPRWLDDFFDQAIEELKQQHALGLLVEALEAFRDTARTNQKVFLLKPEFGVRSPLAQVSGQVRRAGDKGVARIEVEVALDLPFFERLLQKAKDQPFYRDAAIMLLYKEGITILDIRQHPEFYLELDELKRTFSEATPNQRSAELAKRFAAHLIEAEAVGYRAILEELQRQRRGIRLETIQQLRQTESDPQQSALLDFFKSALEFLQDQTAQDQNRELFLKTSLLLGFVTVMSQDPLAKAFLDILLAEGLATRDPHTGALNFRLDPTFFKFLIDPNYVGKAEKRSALEKEAQKPLVDKVPDTAQLNQLASPERAQASQGASSPVETLSDKGGIDGSTSSPSLSSERKAPGGIDLRALPIVTQPAISPQPAVPSPQLISFNLNLDKEWQQIERMLAAGIIPSSERIREYLAICCEKEGMDKEIDKVLACIADILRLEEERSQTTEPALKGLLVLLESDKPAKEMQHALSLITVLPKEPKAIAR